jgi:hypothetical protein
MKTRDLCQLLAPPERLQAEIGALLVDNGKGFPLERKSAGRFSFFAVAIPRRRVFDVLVAD